jgi:hypothetical protein
MYPVNFAGYISAAISGGPGCLSLRCPDPSCGAMVLQGMINKLAKDDDKEKYSRFVLRAYVEDSKKVIFFNKLTHVPHPTVILARRVYIVLTSCSFFFGVCNSLMKPIFISCRLSGAQLLIVTVQWSFLVMRTTTSRAIASSTFAGTYDGSVLIIFMLFSSGHICMIP